MFRTAVCFHLGVLSRGRVVLGDRGAEFPESPALDAEVIAGPQPDTEFPERPALGTEVVAPDLGPMLRTFQEEEDVPCRPWSHSMEAVPRAFEGVLGTLSRECRGTHLPTRRP